MLLMQADRAATAADAEAERANEAVDQIRESAEAAQAVAVAATEAAAANLSDASLGETAAKEVATARGLLLNLKLARERAGKAVAASVAARAWAKTQAQEWSGCGSANRPPVASLPTTPVRAPTPDNDVGSKRSTPMDSPRDHGDKEGGAAKRREAIQNSSDGSIAGSSPVL